MSGGRTLHAWTGSILLSLDTGRWDSGCLGAHGLCRHQQSSMRPAPCGRNTTSNGLNHKNSRDGGLVGEGFAVVRRCRGLQRGGLQLGGRDWHHASARAPAQPSQCTRHCHCHPAEPVSPLPFPSLPGDTRSPFTPSCLCAAFSPTPLSGGIIRSPFCSLRHIAVLTQDNRGMPFGQY